jgi:membrane fusion protein, multidrug efflux system
MKPDHDDEKSPDAGGAHKPRRAQRGEHGPGPSADHKTEHGHQAEHGHKASSGQQSAPGQGAEHRHQAGPGGQAEHGRETGHAAKSAPGHSSTHQKEHVKKVKPRTLWLIALFAGLAFLILFIVGFWIRHDRVKKREKMAKEMRDQPLVVQTVQPKRTQKSFNLTLPADIHPFAAAALYARTSGYLGSWKVDINDRVRPGQVMAVISAPDTDADLEQARAALRQQEAGHALTVATERRFRGLVEIQGVTQEQLDQNHSAEEQAGANVAAAAATVDRLKALVGFEQITAPFAGVVTARNYDVGALISASNIGPGQELFDLVEDDRLRVFVNVPQADALLIRYDQPAALTLERNYPGHKFTGQVSRSTGALDPVTRTLRIEIDFENDDPAFHIFPGMYGVAILTIQRDAAVLTVPTSALMFEAEGKRVAIVTGDNKIHFQPIVPGSDFGTEIEITSGLKGDERVVSNPGEQLTEGIAVSPKAEDDKSGAGGAQAQGGDDAKSPGNNPGQDSSGKGSH